MRIVAGRLGGRRLVAPRGRATRPTLDRVRESLFAILDDVSGARVLDLYAGSGALGLEALSRGAARATFVEHDREALEALESNVRTLGVGDACTVLRLAAERSVRTLAKQGPYDLILCDPPYELVGRAADLLGQLARDALAPSARVVLEHAARDEPEVPGLERVDHRRYGDTGLSFFQARSADEQGPGAGAT